MVDQEQREALTFAWWAAPVLIAINVAPWAGLAWGSGAWGLGLPATAFLITFASTMLLYYIGYEGTHFLMHKPTIGWIERSRAFRFIERHHRIHHVRMNRNLNVLLPLADLVMGTLETKLPTPVPTPAGARQIARRHSIFGRKERAGSGNPSSAEGSSPREGGPHGA